MRNCSAVLRAALYFCATLTPLVKLSRRDWRTIWTSKRLLFNGLCPPGRIFWSGPRAADSARSLYYRLAEVTLPLPSLRERKEDIEGLSLLYINEYNAKYGKQVVGLRDEAREELERFEWRGNIHQLRQVIEEAVLLAKGLYIEQGEISEVLSTRRMRTEYGKPDFDLSGTLEEIEQRIIQQVLLEEGMNQVKTAERLGISRTTLWRKIK